MIVQQAFFQPEGELPVLNTLESIEDGFYGHPPAMGIDLKRFPFMAPTYDNVDTTVLRNEEPIMMVKSGIETSIAIPTASSVVTDVEEPKVETNLGNNLTKSEKWAWVIGLTFAAWALIYWTNKKSN